MDRSPRGRAASRLVAVLLALALVATACGGNDKKAKTSASDDDAGTPKRGGSLEYTLGGETTGGWCLPEAQLSSGLSVADAIYDTLTVPNADGEAVPFLAESLDPNPDYTQWTIKLRPGVKFHDGTALDATVLKNNLDAYRGKYPTRKPLLFVFVFKPVTDVSVVDPLTVRVTMDNPWVAFPWILYGSGRVGIMAQAQLDDTATCDQKMIGTGPFKQKEWRQNDRLTAVRNPDYWQKAPDGKPYPYLDQIVFRPITDEGQRLNSLQSGSIDMMSSGLGSTLKTLRSLQDDGSVRLNEVKKPNSVGYIMLNASKPPFDDITMRQAVAYAANNKEYNDIINAGLYDIANGPFAPGGLGYVKDTGFPTFDLPKAKQLVADYEKKTGKPVRIVLNSVADPSIQRIAELVKQQAGAAGIDVTIRSVDQSTIINLAIGGDFQATLWTNDHPGGDPDLQYNWWYSTSVVNFGRMKDPVIDKALDDGRREPDRAKRQEIYATLNRSFGKNVWNVWSTYTKSSVASTTKVHGLLPAKLPNGDKPYYLRVTGDPLYSIWKD